MKRLITLLALLHAASAFAQNEFITTWKTDNAGTSNSTSITIPTTGTGYDYHVDWDNDGVMDEFNLTGDVTHDFGVAGTYTIRITGDFPRIYFNGGGDRQKILDVSQWGNNPWVAMDRAFNGCSNLDISATDAPDLSSISSINGIFRSCSSLTGGISTWDVSNVVNFGNAFRSASSFNGALNNWDVSNATIMAFLFSGCGIFNQPLDNWDVGNVKTFYRTFGAASSFNQDISGWDTGSANHFERMFVGALSFDQDLSSWDVSNVQTADLMLHNVTLSTAHYDSLLVHWSAQTLQPGVNFSAGNSNYCTAVTERSNMINLSGWTITDGGLSCSTLPIELSEFTIDCENERPLLQWTTTSQINNDYFTIERGRDTEHFELMAIIDGAGNNFSEQNYSWRDDSPLSGTAYYRLSQVDFDGTTQQIAFESTRCNTGSSLIYPNPFTNAFTFHSAFHGELILLDQQGKVILRQEVNSGETTIDTGSIDNGIYTVVYNSANGKREIQKIVRL